MGHDADERAALPPVRHARVVEQLRWSVRELRSRATALRELARRAAEPSPMALLLATEEPGTLSEEAEAVAQRIELFASELEAMCSPQERPGARLRLLLVERNAELARTFGNVLGRRYELVGIVSRAGQAIQCLSQEVTDVIIVGEQLAGEMTGLQLLTVVARHWPSVRRILHAEGDEPAGSAADAVVFRPASALDVIAAVERLS
jgi:hypothetical protein